MSSLLAELGLLGGGEPAALLMAAAPLRAAKKPPKKKQRRERSAETLPQRRSTRIRNQPAPEYTDVSMLPVEEIPEVGNRTIHLHGVWLSFTPHC